MAGFDPVEKQDREKNEEGAVEDPQERNPAHHQLQSFLAVADYTAAAAVQEAHDHEAEKRLKFRHNA